MLIPSAWCCRFPSKSSQYYSEIWHRSLLQNTFTINLLILPTVCLPLRSSAGCCRFLRVYIGLLSGLSCVLSPCANTTRPGVELLVLGTTSATGTAQPITSDWRQTEVQRQGRAPLWRVYTNDGQWEKPQWKHPHHCVVIYVGHPHPFGSTSIYFLLLYLVL